MIHANDEFITNVLQFTVCQVSLTPWSHFSVYPVMVLSTTWMTSVLAVVADLLSASAVCTSVRLVCSWASVANSAFSSVFRALYCCFENWGGKSRLDCDV